MDLISRRGMTLTEILIAMLLIGVAFVGCATVYVTALRFFNDAQSRSSQVLGFIAMEHIARKAELANDMRVNNGGTANGAVGANGIIQGTQLKLRWDFYATNATPLFAPRNTPEDTADDTWVKYGFVSGKLRWRWGDATVNTDVTASDEEVESTLVTDASSTFGLLTTTGDGAPHVIRTTLATISGDPPETTTLVTDSALGAKAKA